RAVDHGPLRNGSGGHHHGGPAGGAGGLAGAGLGSRGGRGRGPGRPAARSSGGAGDPRPYRNPLGVDAVIRTMAMTLTTMPVISMFRATRRSTSRFTSQAIRPPSHPTRMGSSHQAALTLRGVGGGAP